MEIKGLILSNGIDREEEVVEAKKRAKPSVTYKVEVCSGCDFAISRNTSKTQQLFVVLMSQNQFYLKNGGDIENINPKNMTRFFSDMQEPIQIPSNWIKALQRGKEFADYFCSLLDNYYSSVIKIGLFGATGNKSCDSNEIRLYKMNHVLYKYMIHKISSFYNIEEIHIKCNIQHNNSSFACKEGRTIPEKAKRIFEEFSGVNFFASKYGIEYAKKFIDEFLESYATQIPKEYYLNGLLDMAEFQPHRLIEYIMYDLPRQGYGVSGWRNSMSDAITELTDTLRMQKILYGKIREKYPEYLSSLHVKLSNMLRVRQDIIDADGFENEVEEMKNYEWKPDGYKWQIICPKNKEDMIDEANQQQNCLASYVSRVADGTSRIYFLRSSKNEDSDKSVVTIETTPDNKIVQVKARNNREASKEHLNFIKMWAENKNLKVEV